MVRTAYYPDLYTGKMGIEMEESRERLATLGDSISKPKDGFTILIDEHDLNSAGAILTGYYQSLTYRNPSSQNLPDGKMMRRLARVTVEYCARKYTILKLTTKSS
jgi:hypothetical protein